jgi:hypothetical protein
MDGAAVMVDRHAQGQTVAKALAQPQKRRFAQPPLRARQFRRRCAVARLKFKGGGAGAFADEGGWFLHSFHYLLIEK